MELYLTPSADTTSAVTRAAVLAVLGAAGFKVASDESDAKADGVTFWRLRLADTDVAVDFQEREGVLTFATVDVAALDATSAGDRVCGVLEAAGWELDQENVG